MKKLIPSGLLIGGLTILGLATSAPAQAQLPSLIPPVEIAAGAFTAGSSGGTDQNGLALKASMPIELFGDHGVAASAFYLNGNDMQFYALTGEYRRRFGPFSVGYWALGGGIGSSDGNRATLDDGAVWTAGLGAQLVGLSLEARALSSFGGGSTAAMVLLGYKF